MSIYVSGFLFTNSVDHISVSLGIGNLSERDSIVLQLSLDMKCIGFKIVLVYPVFYGLKQLIIIAVTIEMFYL